MTKSQCYTRARRRQVAGFFVCGCQQDSGISKIYNAFAARGGTLGNSLSIYDCVVSKVDVPLTQSNTKNPHIMNLSTIFTAAHTTARTATTGTYRARFAAGLVAAYAAAKVPACRFEVTGSAKVGMNRSTVEQYAALGTVNLSVEAFRTYVSFATAYHMGVAAAQGLAIEVVVLPTEAAPLPAHHGQALSAYVMNRTAAPATRYF